MKIRVEKGTIIYHLVEIFKIISWNIRELFINGSNWLEKIFKSIREKRKQRKIAKAKKLLEVENV